MYKMFYIKELFIYHSMLCIDVEILAPAPDDSGCSIIDVNRSRPNVLCSLASCIFFNNACSAARRKPDGESNCTNTTEKCNVGNYSFVNKTAEINNRNKFAYQVYGIWTGACHVINFQMYEYYIDILCNLRSYMTMITGITQSDNKLFKTQHSFLSTNL